MAILIVDRDPRTRHAIRTMLKLAYSGVMIETRDFTEAARILEQNKTKIRYIIAGLLKEDQSETAVFGKIKNQSIYDSIPTIGLVSHSLIFGPKSYSNVRFRVDAYLKRPFSAESLHNSLKVASINRLRSRYLLGYLGAPDSKNVETLQTYLQSENYFLKDLQILKDPHDLMNRPQTVLRKLGAILIDPSQITSKETLTAYAAGISQFRKTPSGQKISVICLGHDPKKVGALRDQADLFLPFETFEDPKHLRMIEEFLISHWELDHNLQLIKQALPIKSELNSALSKRLIQKAPFYIHGYLQYAGYLESKQKFEQARVEYEKAISVNPFSPRAYLKLILLLEKRNAPISDIRPWISKAFDHCPGHPEIQSLHRQLSAQ